MAILEVIHLRFSGAALAGLREQIHASLRTERQAVAVAVYRRLDLDSDFAVHVSHPDGTRPLPSRLAECLATELRAHGLVDHTVWTTVESRECES